MAVGGDIRIDLAAICSENATASFEKNSAIFAIKQAEDALFPTLTHK